MKATENQMSYNTALSELEEIIRKIEGDKFGIDELIEQVKKASELIHFCKDKLRSTEEEVEKIIKQMEK
jgi:exodeoxyribonuclease VII small subunit